MKLSAAHSALKSATLVALFATTPLCAQVNYGDYNFITHGNLSISNHVNSAAIVGGNLLLGNNSSVAQTRADKFGTGIMVYGNVSATTGTLDFQNSANFYFANNAVNIDKKLSLTGGGLLNLQNAGSNLVSDPLTTANYKTIGFNGLWSRIVGTASSLKNHADTLTLADLNFASTNQDYFNLPGAASSSGTSYITFDLTQDLSLLKVAGTTNFFSKSGTGASTIYNTLSGPELIFNNASATNKLVINVIGTAGSTFNFNSYTNSSANSSVLWNFSGISNINLNSGRQFNGSILAPSAAVTFAGSQNLYGQVFADSYNGTGGGEYHGEANFFTTDLGPIPEPSTYALFGAGTLAGLSFLRRRRARKAA